MSGITIARLRAERKAWRKDHPIDFYARPSRKADGSQNLMVWECGIPGKKGTDWEGGIYKCVVKFPSNYPASGPKVTFKPLIWHMNVYGSGDVCLDILASRWKSSLTIKQILLGLQNLLDEPNPKSPANSAASSLYQRDRPAYNKKIKEQARKFTPSYASYSGGGGDDDDITIIE